MDKTQKTMRHMVSLAMTVFFAVVLVACSPSDPQSADAGVAASAAPEGGYYDGETITLVMGLDASAGGTTVGRLFAKHLEMNLEGNPTVIVQNMPGASMMIAHIHVLSRARRDGTTVYYGPRSSLGELLNFPGHSFKYEEFTILGGAQLAPLVTFMRKDMLDGGIQTPADVLRADGLIYGGISAEHGRMIASTMGLDLLGVNYHFVGGYPGSGRIRAAVLSGEVNMAVDAAHAYLNEAVPILEQEDLNAPLFSLPQLTGDGSLVKSALVPDIPTINELYEEINGEPPFGTSWDAIRTMIEIDQTMQHVFLGPPEMDPAAVDTFRAVLRPMMESEAFIEEATRILSYAPEVVEHERAASILAATGEVTDEVKSFIEANIARNNASQNQ